MMREGAERRLSGGSAWRNSEPHAKTTTTALATVERLNITPP
jgi:hypothetical protein